MTLETGSDGITRVTDVQPRGSAHEASVVKGSVVIAVAGCTLERGQVLLLLYLKCTSRTGLSDLCTYWQGQDGLIPLTAICGHSTVEFRWAGQYSCYSAVLTLVCWSICWQISTPQCSCKEGHLARVR
eukprot:SAG31_NODE_1482_length_8175_cov_4.484398_11_plen_128_part_00